MFKDIIRPALILFLICVLITGALAYVNGVTNPMIKETEEKIKQEGLIKVFPGAEGFSDPKSAESLKAEGIQSSERIVNIYEAQKSGASIGYVVEVSSKGYGGAIEMLIGIDQAQNITGVILTGHNETPGLGSKASQPSFIEQYVGAIPAEFNVVKGKAQAEGDIQAISGATITSRAVTQGVADAAALVRSLAGGV